MTVRMISQRMRRIPGAAYELTVRRENRLLEQAEKASAKQLQRLQRERLVRLLLHAYRHVPYYRELLADTGVVTRDGEVALERYPSLPFLTKDILRTRFEQLKSDDLSRRRWSFNTSGGSTGEPVRFIQDTEYRRWARAAKIRFDAWTGYRAGAPKILLWSSERDLLVGQETAIVRSRRWLKNELWLNGHRMTPERMRLYVKKINEVHPKQILAFAESLFELARFAERAGVNVDAQEAIMTSAGTLYPEMRRAIERVFGAPVFDRYGSREVGDMACECEAHAGLHVSPLTHHIEVVRPDGSEARPGELGEVVVTLLTNLAMPLIRYQIGDQAVAGSKDRCGCGCDWPRLQRIEGRLKDSFVTRDGTIVRVPDFFFYFKDWVRQFQFIQEDYDRVRLLLVPTASREQAGEYISQDRPELERQLGILMGGLCKLEIDLVNEIPCSPSGKFRYTISKVADRERNR